MAQTTRSSMRSLHRVVVSAGFAVVTLISAGCDKYEGARAIEGVYSPRQCVTLQAIEIGWFGHTTTQQPVCQPMRVSELGFYTYGSGWSRPGVQAEVGRLEWSDAGLYVESGSLRGSGTFEYRERDATLTEWGRNNPIKAIVFSLLGIVLAVGISMNAAERRSRMQRERDQLAANAEAAAAARAAGLAALRRLVSEVQVCASSLPILLSEAEMILDQAQDELASQLPSPFWEAMEDAVNKLRDFHGSLATIGAKRTEYRTKSAQLGGDVPSFTLGVSVLPDPTATQSRLTRLYREAQAIPHFSIVYEQRRTTSVLIAGFRSLGQAIERLGDRIVDEIGSLAASLDCRLANLESSLESSAAAAAEQSAALRAQLQRADDVSDAFRVQVRQDAAARSETQRLALRMLDNIQRRRKPTMFERP